VIEINVRADTKKLERSLNDLAYKQLPFATAQALTAVGRLVQGNEKAALPSIFDKPTPFTSNSIGLIPARKDNPVATVFVKDIAAAYLAPYEFGGRNKGVGRHDTFLRPANIRLNQYGNLPRSKLAQLKAKANVFVGKIKGKDGQEIDGVWQRVKASKGKPASVKLLIKFEDPHPARQHLDYRKRAEQRCAPRDGGAPRAPPVDDSLHFKGFQGMRLELLSASPNNLINKSAPRIVADEIDAYPQSLGDVKALLDVRRQTFGRHSMLLALSHPDLARGVNPARDWSAGIMALYADSDRRVWYWPCPHCGSWSSPAPIAARHMAIQYPEQGTLDEIEAQAASCAL
jgi:hypothetical protein